LGENQNIGGENGGNTDERIGISQLLGARIWATPKSTPMLLLLFQQKMFLKNVHFCQAWVVGILE